MPLEMNSPRFDKILVVDDATATLQFLTNLLTKHGYTVYPASNGKLALEFIRSTLPHLILLDIRMPGMDGYEVCRRLKADERTRAIPVIFITILEDEGDKVKGFRTGAVDYITKPFQSEEVLARVQIHLQLRELTEHLEHKIAARTEALHSANAQLQHELTERKQVEAALRQSETLLNATQQLAKVGGWQWDVEKQTGFWTEETYRIHGFTPQASVPGSYESIDRSLACYDPAGHPVILAAFQRCIEQGDDYDLELPFTSADGLRKWIRTTATAVREQGQIVKVVGNIMDITERKTAEEALRRLNLELDQQVLDRTAQLEVANKDLEAFAYSVSHDLRAPLRHIDEFTELLKKMVGTSFGEQGRHYMDTICDQVKKMGRLIDDLLSFSRMGRHTVSFKPVELELLVREVIGELAPDVAGRTIDWRIDELPTVSGDAAMLRMVMFNLITNALKFTRPREKAQIEIGSLPGQNGEAVIFVRDNGVGFNMTYRDKLFGVFQRLHRADEFEGTGIGLANVRRIINRHSGRTWAQGEPDRGATFFFSIPHALHGGGDGKP
jgi:PAS domain S-box-containing protein